MPVVDNNRKVVGALSVVGEKFSTILVKFAKFSGIFEQQIELCSIFRKMLHFGKIPKKIDHNLAKIDFKIQKILTTFEKNCLKNQQNFQQFLTKKLSLENGAKECIVKISARAF
jgi:hypothetical protein